MAAPAAVVRSALQAKCSVWCGVEWSGEFFEFGVSSAASGRERGVFSLCALLLLLLWLLLGNI